MTCRQWWRTSFLSRQSAGTRWPSWCLSYQISTAQCSEQLSRRCLETQRDDGILPLHEPWEERHCCAPDLACPPRYQQLECMESAHQHLLSPSPLLSIITSRQTCTNDGPHLTLFNHPAGSQSSSHFYLTLYNHPAGSLSSSHFYLTLYNLPTVCVFQWKCENCREYIYPKYTENYCQST